MHKIKLLVMDVDGTLTDGRLYIGPDGEVMKAFDVKDGGGIASFRNAGGIPVIISARRSRILEQRCRELAISDLYQGTANKLDALMEVASKYRVTREEIAYIGDDLNDLECLEYAGISACPSDAAEIVRSICSYVCTRPGGRGAVREFADYLVKEQ